MDNMYNLGQDNNFITLENNIFLQNNNMNYIYVKYFKIYPSKSRYILLCLCHGVCPITNQLDTTV